MKIKGIIQLLFLFTLSLFVLLACSDSSSQADEDNKTSTGIGGSSDSGTDTGGDSSTDDSSDTDSGTDSDTDTGDNTGTGGSSSSDNSSNTGSGSSIDYSIIVSDNVLSAFSSEFINNFRSSIYGVISNPSNDTTAHIQEILTYLVNNGVGDITNTDLATAYGKIVAEYIMDISDAATDSLYELIIGDSDIFSYSLKGYESHFKNLITTLYNINNNAENIDELVKVAGSINKELMEYNLNLDYAKAASYLALVALDYCVNNSDDTKAGYCNSGLLYIKYDYSSFIQNEDYYIDITNATTKNDSFYLSHFKAALQLYLDAAYLTKYYADIWDNSALSKLYGSLTLSDYISEAENVMDKINDYTTVSALVNSGNIENLADYSASVPYFIYGSGEWVLNTKTGYSYSAPYYVLMVGDYINELFTTTGMEATLARQLIPDNLKYAISIVQNLEVKIDEENFYHNLYYFVASFVGKLDSDYISGLEDEYVLPENTNDDISFYEYLAYVFFNTTGGLTISSLNADTSNFAIGNIFTSAQNEVVAAFEKYGYATGK